MPLPRTQEECTPPAASHDVSHTGISNISGDTKVSDSHQGGEHGSSDCVDSMATPGFHDGTICRANARSPSKSTGDRTISTQMMLCGPIRANLGYVFFDRKDKYHAYLYFVRSVALIIPACGTGLRNGYQQVAQLALSSPVLLDTLISVSSVYMHLHGLVPQSVALRRQCKALASLRNSVDSLTMQAEISPHDLSRLRRDLLATILLQITVEIANGTSVIQTHVGYAFQLFQSLKYDKQKPTSSVGVALVQRMAFIDVLSSVFWSRRPLLSLEFWLSGEEEDYLVDEKTPSFQETTGCSLSIMSSMATISHMAADLDNGMNEDGVVSSALQLESTLTSSSQKLSDTPLPTTPHPNDFQYLNTVCECHLLSALILLQRRLLRDSRAAVRVQFYLARLIDLIECLPLGCGPDSQLSLPLYVAAHVAITHQQRDRLRSKSSSLCGIYPLKTREALTAAFDKMWTVSDSSTATGGSGGLNDSDPMKENALFIC
ncbi:uncharacterized protein LTR77_000002 [Saxophila tyrrhenica]|uniref:Uncharacterized protein n=1 Tax=Saxophila tyrrhenica TaxID=1690608 RepID=A0AAV9PLK6_9PEZI|nr:hypothetical protein LTR77_000002 [Saxophila tyrrhenica]